MVSWFPWFSSCVEAADGSGWDVCIGHLILSRTHHFMAVGSEEKERERERRGKIACGEGGR